MSTYTIEEYRNVFDELGAILNSITSNEESLNDGQILRVILDTLNEELRSNERIMPYNGWMDEFENHPEIIEIADAAMATGSPSALNLIDADFASAEEQTILQYGQAYGQHVINTLRAYYNTITYCPEVLLHDIVSNVPYECRQRSRIRAHVLQIIGHERRHTEQSDAFKMECRLELHHAVCMRLVDENELARKYNELPSEVDANTAGILFAIERL